MNEQWKKILRTELKNPIECEFFNISEQAE